MKSFTFLFFTSCLLIAFLIFNSKNYLKSNFEKPEVLENTTTSSSGKVKSSNNQVAFKNQKYNLSDFIYPNSTKVGSKENTMVLQSFDDPKMINDWYKNKIISTGVETTSFMQSVTYNNVDNKLLGQEGKLKIQIEIKKQSGQEKTLIGILLSN